MKHHQLRSILLTSCGQSLFTCPEGTALRHAGILDIALSVASVPIAGYSMVSSLYAVLPTALIIVHFDGTSILSLHTQDEYDALNAIINSTSLKHTIDVRKVDGF